MKSEIIPGILTHNLETYTAKLEQVEASNSPWAHIDVMDGQFVPNITVMPHEFMGISTKLHLEAHLMTFNSERFFSDLSVAGVTRVLLHREAYESFAECQQSIKQAADYFPEVVLVLNPETELEDYSSLAIRGIQCMGVHPGRSGQPFIEDVYATIETLSRAYPSLVIEVDGGVHEDNIQQLQQKGARRFVISSHIFVSSSVTASIQHFSQLVGGI